MKENIFRGIRGTVEVCNMMYLYGDVILYDAFDMEDFSSAEMQSILAEWAMRHGGGKPMATTSRNVAFSPLHAGIKIVGCMVPQNEIDQKGMLMVGPYKAYMGDYALRDLPDEPAKDPVDFASWLESFFEAASMSQEEREAILNMSLREFLQHCKAAAESLASPKLYGISKKSLLSGQKVKCPACEKGFLRLVDGMVDCPSCDFSLGDIDQMPDLV